ncbi:bacteriophage Gp15 family protein [uncultured Clostridium sp.]|uniref:bacteriophage Gp15 family protein n=1 Tax=uncultured Clostridium sp. TaxID=59620 RepID=UPI0028EFA38B|nr:bacteriophage Gp15 family protein [uncultured Clostridium sp.]
MNILTNALPQTVNIGGFEVKINTDFKTSIMFEELLNEYDLTDEGNQIKVWEKAIKLYYPIEIPKKLKIEAVNRLIWFYRGDKEIENVKENKPSKNDIYSYSYDAEKIYSAFKADYNIDLNIEELHWWKFKALFWSLKEDNEIKKIMSIRALDTSNLSKEQQEHYKKLKKIYAIPRSKKEIKHNKNLATILKRGGTLSELKE